MKKEKLEIDGSYGEGGGQLIRNSCAYAALLQKSIKIVKIRHNRPNGGGLKRQHLTGVQLIANGFFGKDHVKLSGDQVGSKELVFEPLRSLQLNPSKTYTADIQTAGSTTLLIQTSLPCLVFGSLTSQISSNQEQKPHPEVQAKPGNGVATQGVENQQNYLNVRIIGGTDVSRSPPADEFRFGFLQFLRYHFGIHCELDIERRGFFPKGGGILNLRLLKRSLPTSQSNNLQPLISAMDSLELSAARTTISSQDLGVTSNMEFQGFLDPIVLLNRGKIINIDVYCYTASKQQISSSSSSSSSSNAESKIFSEEFSNEVFALIQEMASKTLALSPSIIKLKRKEHDKKMFSNVAIYTVIVTTDTGAMFAATSSYGASEEDGKEKKMRYKKKKSSSKKTSSPKQVDTNDHPHSNNFVKPIDLATKVIKKLQHHLEGASKTSCVDEYMQDQIIIFMALAKGKSTLRCSKPLTMHTTTAIHISQLISEAKFTTIEDDDSVLIECEGIGLNIHHC